MGDNTRSKVGMELFKLGGWESDLAMEKHIAAFTKQVCVPNLDITKVMGRDSSLWRSVEFSTFVRENKSSFGATGSHPRRSARKPVACAILEDCWAVSKRKDTLACAPGIIRIVLQGILDNAFKESNMRTEKLRTTHYEWPDRLQVPADVNEDGILEGEEDDNEGDDDEGDVSSAAAAVKTLGRALKKNEKISDEHKNTILAWCAAVSASQNNILCCGTYIMLSF